MKNTFDILVNFNNYPYEFYEWNKDDKILHIKKMPCIKVTRKTLYDFINNDVIVNSKFLKEIENKTEFFNNKLLQLINYSCILFCDDIALAFSFDEKGKIIMRSNMLFDEEEDVIKSCYDLKETIIQYEIISLLKKDTTHTRTENAKISFLLKYLNTIYQKRKEEEIKYLYFECFNEKNDDYNMAYKRLVKEINKINHKIINKLNSIIKVLKK